MLVEDRTAREDVWTRATPVLAFVLIVEVILAGNLDWPPWTNALVLLAALAAAVGLLARAIPLLLRTGDRQGCSAPSHRA